MNQLTLRNSLPAERHPAAVYLAGLAPGSRRAMVQALNTMAGILTGGRANAQTLDWSRIRYQHAAAIRAALAERYKPNTTNRHLAALRGVVKQAWRLGYIDAEAQARIADLPNVKGAALQAGRALSRAELEALFGACETGTAMGLRDRAIFALLYGGGLRRSEVAAMCLEDLEAPEMACIVNFGKGRKSRRVFLPEGAWAAVSAWVGECGRVSGPLFGITAEAILYVCRRRAAAAGIDQFSPHDLRRSYISDLIDAGADLSAIKNLAGHADVKTTLRYDRRGERAQQKAAALLEVPA